MCSTQPIRAWSTDSSSLTRERRASHLQMSRYCSTWGSSRSDRSRLKLSSSFTRVVAVDGSSMLSLRPLNPRWTTSSRSSHHCTRLQVSHSACQTTWSSTRSSRPTSPRIQPRSSPFTPRMANLSPMARRAQTSLSRSRPLSTESRRLVVSWSRRKKCSGPMRSEVHIPSTRFRQLKAAAWKTSWTIGRLCCSLTLRRRTSWRPICRRRSMRALRNLSESEPLIGLSTSSGVSPETVGARLEGEWNSSRKSPERMDRVPRDSENHFTGAGFERGV